MTPSKEQLEEAYGRLKSLRAVGRLFGIPEGSVSKRLREAGITVAPASGHRPAQTSWSNGLGKRGRQAE